MNSGWRLLGYAPPAPPESLRSDPPRLRLGATWSTLNAAAIRRMQRIVALAQSCGSHALIIRDEARLRGVLRASMPCDMHRLELCDASVVRSAPDFAYVMDEDVGSLALRLSDVNEDYACLRGGVLLVGCLTDRHCADTPVLSLLLSYVRNAHVARQCDTWCLYGVCATTLRAVRHINEIK